VLRESHKSCAQVCTQGRAGISTTRYHKGVPSYAHDKRFSLRENEKREQACGTTCDHFCANPLPSTEET
jgi:hypothetical protein